MEKIFLWDEELIEQFPKVSLERIDEFLDLIQYIQENNMGNVIDEEVIDEEVLEKESLWEWIYAKDDIRLNDLKKELSKKIQKVRGINSKKASELKKQIGSMGGKKVFVLYFSKDSKSPYYIETRSQYFKALWKYLSRENKNDFSEDMKECFPNIVFHKDVKGSLNTLNRKFEEIRGEIVEHLGQLNEYQKKFLKLADENRSYREIADIFTKDTGIACSPQAGRKSVKELKIEVYNNITKETEEITCELHTKFSKYNINPEKQDRIYFFPGKKGIENGYVIVKHIGKHL